MTLLTPQSDEDENANPYSPPSAEPDPAEATKGSKLKNMSGQPSSLEIALRLEVVKRASILALIVGGILIAINHGTCLTSGMFNVTCLWQSVLTFFVPYAVSTVSSVMAINCQNNAESDV